MASLRAVSPALLMIFSYAGKYLQFQALLENTVDHNNNGGENYATNIAGEVVNATAAYVHLLESSSRCLSILFDLFPDALTSQLLSDQSILLDNAANSAPESDMSRLGISSPTRQILKQGITPRMVLAELLSNAQVSNLFTSSPKVLFYRAEQRCLIVNFGFHLSIAG